MPDKPLDSKKSLWVNFMREHKHKFPIYEHLSRKYYYALAAKEYQRFKKFYINNFNPTQRNALFAIRSYLNPPKELY
jgi:hypothetical protein